MDAQSGALSGLGLLLGTLFSTEKHTKLIAEECLVATGNSGVRTVHTIWSVNTMFNVEEWHFPRQSFHSLVIADFNQEISVIIEVRILVVEGLDQRSGTAIASR